MASPKITKRLKFQLPRFFEIAEKAMRISHVPGMAIGIVYRGELIASKGFGIKNINKPGSLVSPETMFLVASVLKPVTSSIIAQQVGLGSINWRTKIYSIDKDFILPNGVTKKVTIGD